MRLTVINASPRRKGGNTETLLKHFLEGFHEEEGNTSNIVYIHDIDTDEAARKIFLESEALLLAFPLYSYGLPPAAIRWAYRLNEFSGKKSSVKMAFLCQYGFREACHARTLEKQLEGFCRELNIDNLGMIIRGGCEGMKYKPEAANRKLYAGFREMGRTLGRSGRFSRQELDRFAAPEYSRSGMFTPLKLKIGIYIANRFFWGAQLKENGVTDRHWDRPLLEN